MQEKQQARQVVKNHPAEISDLKESKMDGPTFRALREYFDDWGKEDPTLFKTEQRDVKRESK